MHISNLFAATLILFGTQAIAGDATTPGGVFSTCSNKSPQQTLACIITLSEATSCAADYAGDYNDHLKSPADAINYQCVSNVKALKQALIYYRKNSDFCKNTPCTVRLSPNIYKLYDTTDGIAKGGPVVPLQVPAHVTLIGSGNATVLISPPNYTAAALTKAAPLVILKGDGANLTNLKLVASIMPQYNNTYCSVTTLVQIPTSASGTINLVGVNFDLNHDYYFLSSWYYFNCVAHAIDLESSKAIQINVIQSTFNGVSNNDTDRIKYTTPLIFDATKKNNRIQIYWPVVNHVKQNNENPSQFNIPRIGYGNAMIHLEKNNTKNPSKVYPYKGKYPVYIK